MTLDQLRHFVAAATAKNLSTAASQLYISHSAISRSITALENEFGVTLLNRSSRAVECTRAGQLLLMRGRNMLHEVDAIARDVAAIGDGDGEILRFSCAIPFGPRMMEFVHQFQADHPGLELQYLNSTPFQASANLSRGRCDIAITYSYTHPGNYPMLRSVPLDRGDFYLVASKRNPLANRPFVTFNDIPNLAPRQIVDRPSERKAENSEKARAIAVAHETSVEDLLLAVRMNQDCCTLPEHSIRNIHDDQCVKVPLRGRPMDVTYEVVLFFHDDNPNPMVKRFVDALLESDVLDDFRNATREETARFENHTS